MLIFHFSFFNCFAQQKEIRIINADLFEYKNSGDKKIETLSGNVQLEQQGVTLYCNQADLYPDENNVEATGNVHIVQDTVNIYSDKLFYRGNDRKAQLTGNVRLTDTKMTLTTDRLDYDMNARVGNYQTGGVLRNDSSMLTSKIGYYYSATKDVYFKHDVHLTNPKYKLIADTLRYNMDARTAYFLGPTNIAGDSTKIYCEGGYFNTSTDRMRFNTFARLVNGAQHLVADTIDYGRKSGDGLARGHVRWTDTTQKIILTGGIATYNEHREFLKVTKTPVMADASRTDTMFLTADTLFSERQDTASPRRFRAYRRAAVFSKSMQARCDSLTYSDADSIFHFYYDPILWVEKNQLTADTVYMQLRNKQLDQLYMRQNSLIVSPADSTSYNQVRGKTMTGRFVNNELKTLYVDGNGESVYQARDDKNKPIGTNRAVCSRMLVKVGDEKVQRIIFLEKPDATLYPPNEIPPEEAKLKGFRWEAAKKPVRSEFAF